MDELAELPSEFQKKLNDITDNKQKHFRYVGDSENTKTFEGRIIAATIHDPNLQSDKKINEDLFNRFKCKIRIPPLRERPEDIPLLIFNSIKKYNNENKTQIRIDESAIGLLKRQPLIGNIRMLENLIDKAIGYKNLQSNSIICVQDIEYALYDEYGIKFNNNRESLFKENIYWLAKYLIENAEQLIPEDILISNKGGIKSLIDYIEQEILTEALKITDGNVLAAAQLLHENKDTMRYHLKSFGLKHE